MLVVILGADAKERKLKMRDLLAKEVGKSDMHFALFDSLPDRSELLTLVHQSTGFFGERTVVVLRNIIVPFVERDEAVVADLAKAGSVIVFLEEGTTKATLAPFKDAGATIVELPKIEKEKKAFYAPFAICDTFAAKDKFGTWVILSELFQKDESPEAIVGILFSRIRTMLRDKRYGTYSRDELLALSSSLTFLLPNARKEGYESDLALERWVLALS